MTELAPGSPEYWDDRYETNDEQQLSWFQADPARSRALIAQVSNTGASVVDVGGGTSRLVDFLLADGYRDITVVDISAQALASGLERIGDAPVTWIASDIRDWQPARTFDVWHDRAAFHFLTDENDQQAYWQLVRETVPHGGHVIVATFAEDGPQMCSGLPVQRYSSADLEAAMGEGFRVLQALRETHVTPSGGEQSFQWLVAQRT